MHDASRMTQPVSVTFTDQLSYDLHARDDRPNRSIKSFTAAPPKRARDISPKTVDVSQHGERERLLRDREDKKEKINFKVEWHRNSCLTEKLKAMRDLSLHHHTSKYTGSSYLEYAPRDHFNGRGAYEGAMKMGKFFDSPHKLRLQQGKQRCDMFGPQANREIPLEKPINKPRFVNWVHHERGHEMRMRALREDSTGYSKYIDGGILSYLPRGDMKAPQGKPAWTSHFHLHDKAHNLADGSKFTSIETDERNIRLDDVRSEGSGRQSPSVARFYDDLEPLSAEERARQPQSPLDQAKKKFYQRKLGSYEGSCRHSRKKSTETSSTSSMDSNLKDVFSRAQASLKMKKTLSSPTNVTRHSEAGHGTLSTNYRGSPPHNRDSRGSLTRHRRGSLTRNCRGSLTRIRRSSLTHNRRSSPPNPRSTSSNSPNPKNRWATTIKVDDCRVQADKPSVTTAGPRRARNLPEHGNLVNLRRGVFRDGIHRRSRSAGRTTPRESPGRTRRIKPMAKSPSEHLPKPDGKTPKYQRVRRKSCELHDLMPHDSKKDSISMLSHLSHASNETDLQLKLQLADFGLPTSARGQNSSRSTPGAIARDIPRSGPTSSRGKSEVKSHFQSGSKSRTPQAWRAEKKGERKPKYSLNLREAIPSLSTPRRVSERHE